MTSDPFPNEPVFHVYSRQLARTGLQAKIPGLTELDGPRCRAGRRWPFPAAMPGVGIDRAGTAEERDHVPE
jgi:hypothetical protein